MIRIKPEIEHQIFCPQCSHKALANEIIMPSAFALADCLCGNCGFEFYQTLPVGHTIIDSLTINKTDLQLFPASTPRTWLTDALLRALHHVQHKQVHIEKVVYKTCEQVVILNALDFLYGHVLLKLYNSIYHLDNQKNLGLIVIVPQSFKWLVPDGCAEAWIVDLRLSELAYHHLSIQKFISHELERFDIIYLSNAHSHPDFKDIDISRLTGVKPFDLANFNSSPITFTFVLREDRWWLTDVLDYWFYRVCRKLHLLRIGSVVLSMGQNALVRKTISCILKRIPDATFYIVGLGTTGSFKRYAHDKRKQIVDSSVEKEWCEIYAQSHVMVGVHGSNMLLPTAHAAGCVEILPEDRYGNIVQDISVRYHDRKQLYFYRFADQYSSPKTVANKMISIVENFAVFEKNMCRNVYPSEQDAVPVV